jgi:hypothetical protein
MAKEVLRDCVITVNSVDLSDHFRQVTVSGEWNEVDFTSFGNGWEETGKGTRRATISLEAFQDFAPGEVDATLWPLFDGDVTFPVTVKKSSGAISTSNPEFRMTARLMTYSPLDGEVGSASTTSVELVNASQTGLTKHTS